MHWASPAERIHSGYRPVGDDNGQQHKGDEGVEQGGHDVTDGPVDRNVTVRAAQTGSWCAVKHRSGSAVSFSAHVSVRKWLIASGLWSTATDLLASLMRAMAMRIRFRRKMRRRMMMTSRMAKMITMDRWHGSEHARHQADIGANWENGSWPTVKMKKTQIHTKTCCLGSCVHLAAPKCRHYSIYLPLSPVVTTDRVTMTAQ